MSNETNAPDTTAAGGTASDTTAPATVPARVEAIHDAPPPVLPPFRGPQTTLISLTDREVEHMESLDQQIAAEAAVIANLHESIASLYNQIAAKQAQIAPHVESRTAAKNQRNQFVASRATLSGADIPPGASASFDAKLRAIVIEPPPGPATSA